MLFAFDNMDLFIFSPSLPRSRGCQTEISFARPCPLPLPLARTTRTKSGLEGRIQDGFLDCLLDWSMHHAGLQIGSASGALIATAASITWTELWQRQCCQLAQRLQLTSTASPDDDLRRSSAVARGSRVRFGLPNRLADVMGPTMARCDGGQDLLQADIELVESGIDLKDGPRMRIRKQLGSDDLFSDPPAVIASPSRPPSACRCEDGHERKHVGLPTRPAFTRHPLRCWPSESNELSLSHRRHQRRSELESTVVASTLQSRPCSISVV